MWGAAPNTAPVRCRVPPPGVCRVSSLCAGAGSPACRRPRGSRRRGAWGRAACGPSCVPPPGAAAPSGGGGTFLRPRGGGGTAPSLPAGLRGEWGGEGRGGRTVVPRPLPWGGDPWPPGQSPFFSGAPPLGIYVQPGLPASPGPRARPGRPSVGQPGRGGGGAASASYPRGLAWGAPQGRGRGGPFAAVCPPAHAGRAPRRVASAAPMLHFWLSLCRCGPRGALERWRRAAGRQRALRE